MVHGRGGLGYGDRAELLGPLAKVMSGHPTDLLNIVAELLHTIREAIVVAPDVGIEQEAELQKSQPFSLVALEQPAGLEGDEQAQHHGDQRGERRDGLEG